MATQKQPVIRPIQAEIENLIKSYNYTLSKLSELSNINVGHLCGFLKGNENRELTIDQLNAIGQVFGKPIGWLYDLYVEECFRGGKIAKRRVKPYLVQCAELGRYDCIQMVIPKLLEDPNNINFLFDIAEQLFDKGKQKESAYFYKLVVDNQDNILSKRIVMSQYRLFQSAEKTNNKALWQAIVNFEPFRKKLSSEYQLEALLRLTSYYRLLQSWEEVSKSAEELLELAQSIYNEISREQKGTRKRGKQFKLKNSLVVYFGHAYLLKAVSMEKQGYYEKAEELVSRYADLSWFELLDEKGRAEVEYFKLMAMENMYRLDLLKGNTHVLADYITFLENHPIKILSGLLAIMEAANKHRLTVDDILDKFSEEIAYSHNYHDSTNVDQHLQFRYQLAIYQFKNECFQNGIAETLRCLTLSTVMNSSKNFIRCVTLFETYRCHSLVEQEKEYKIILEEVMRDERLNGLPQPLNEERPIVKH
ncbi:DNA-binding protein [Brevibacillus laterosporus]|uniref:DNA-binding protein n=1 Tax=Brevibacillus laterosporus TaxID=1465 RepID=UPI0035A72E39